MSPVCECKRLLILHRVFLVKIWKCQSSYLRRSISIYVRAYLRTHALCCIKTHQTLLDTQVHKITLAHDIKHPLHTLPLTHPDTPQKTLPRWRVTLSCTHPQTLHNLTCITPTHAHAHIHSHTHIHLHTHQKHWAVKRCPYPPQTASTNQIRPDQNMPFKAGTMVERRGARGVQRRTANALTLGAISMTRESERHRHRQGRARKRRGAWAE